MPAHFATPIAMGSHRVHRLGYKLARHLCLQDTPTRCVVQKQFVQGIAPLTQRGGHDHTRVSRGKEAAGKISGFDGISTMHEPPRRCIAIAAEVPYADGIQNVRCILPLVHACPSIPLGLLTRMLQRLQYPRVIPFGTNFPIS